MKIITRTLSLVLALCLGLSCCAFAEGETDYSALLPLMDLVCAASQYSSNAPESITQTEMSAEFVSAFFQAGCLQSDEVGVNAEMLSDPEAQRALLASCFEASAQALDVIEATDEELGFIGFVPKMISEDGDKLQVIGEIYLADTAIRYMEAADFANVSWIERALFVFRKDAEALNGYRLQEFALGTDLSREDAFRAYTEQMVVEYESKLGFMVLYPAFFTDDTITEGDDGIEAKLPDGSAAFFAKRFANTGALPLAEYVQAKSNELEGSTFTINEEMQYATLSRFTAEGQFAFDVYVVTEEYVYQAELSFSADHLADYSMYDAYLENSFMVGELYQG